MQRERATADLDLVRRILEQTRRRVDPQMFHAMVWGSIVLVWYPLMSLFQRAGRERAMLVTSVVAIGAGTLLSCYLGWRAGRRPRLPAANTRLARQIGLLIANFIATGVLLSIAVPVLAPGGETFIPHVWGLLYALMLLALGVVYSGEFFVGGLVSLVATLIALRWPLDAGWILGPGMGLPCIAAGLIAERRVARLRHESVERADDEV